MITKSQVDEFIAMKNFAIVGVSRSGKKFGNSLLKELSEKGYNVFPVNPNAKEINGQKCFNSLSEIDSKIDAVLCTTKPEQTYEVIKDVKNLGIKKVWAQLGAGSEKVAGYCSENDIDLIQNECILMFADPKGIHKFHQVIWKWFGKLPK